MSARSAQMMANKGASVKTVDGSVVAFFWRGVFVSLGRPRQAWRFLRTVRWQAAAAKTRKSWRERGVRVPPIIIFSITHRCNLSCAGCYAQSILGGDAAECDGATVEPRELSDAKVRSIVAEAAELGASFFVVAGGEPLMRAELLAVAERFPRILFLVFTNGVLLDEAMVRRISDLKNIVPLISLEGPAEQTDARRGEGTYEQLTSAMSRLRSRHAFFGCSLTLTSRNFSTIFSDDYIDGLADAGCRFFLFLDYTPVEPGTEDWVLTSAQRDSVGERMLELRQRHKALFIAVPWDEQETGGCLAAGRGFVHINASGAVEPCPFSPFSDTDLNDVTLLEALKSPLLARLRETPELLKYEGGGCELWQNRAEVERVLEEVQEGGR